MTSEQICEAYPEGVESNILPILNKKLRGYRPYELTLLMGPPKAGKSSVAREIAYDFLISTDEIVCYCSLEDNKRQIADVFVALDNNVPVDKYMFDKTLISKEDVDKTLTTILAPDRFILIDTEEGTIRAREIIGLLEKAVDMGATKFIFDHFSYLTDVSSGVGSSTKQEIDMLLTEVKNLTKNYPIHMIGINHVTIDKSRGIVRDQETGQTTYPYWYRTSRYDGAGSSGFTKITDNLILLDIKFIADEVVGQRQCKLALNRRAIATGACDYFTLDSKTGRLKVTSG
jgi:archaellum biogenesis ATPase FlaH